MLKNPQATKPKKPPKDNNIETSNKEFTFYIPSYSSLFGIGEPQATKPSRGKDTIEISEDKLLATLPTLPTSSSYSLLPSPCPSREDVEKENRRKRRQSSSKNGKENQNQRRRLLIPKPISASIPSSTSSPKQHL